jgi:hypothetical protein
VSRSPATVPKIVSSPPVPVCRFAHGPGSSVTESVRDAGAEVSAPSLTLNSKVLVAAGSSLPAWR